MRKTFVILGLFAIALALCANDAFGRGGRRGGGGCSSGGYYGGGGYGYYGAQGDYYAGGQMPSQFRESFYFDPALQQAARFTIFVPNQDAEVWFDNVPTKLRGMERVFNTPTLQGDGIYTIKARWIENGQPVERERRINVRGGQAHVVDFRVNTQERLPNPNEPNPKTPKPLPKDTLPKELKDTPPKELKETLPKPKDTLPKAKQPDQESPTSLPAAEQAGKGDGKLPMIKIDGEWTAVYAEMDGQKVEIKKLTNVIIKNNVVTCNQDGKPKSFLLEFGPHQMVRCTEQNAAKPLEQPTEQRGTHTHHGVYIASQDYLSLSLNKGIDRRTPGVREEGKERDAQPRAAGWGMGPHGSDMVLILRRAGVASADAR